MNALTTTNVNTSVKIQNIQNPEWGIFTIIDIYDLGIYIIRGRSGETTLFDSEFKFWNIVK